jgi:hypothetical protein
MAKLFVKFKYKDNNLNKLANENYYKTIDSPINVLMIYINKINDSDICFHNQVIKSKI